MDKRIVLEGGTPGHKPEKKYRTYFISNENGCIKIGKTSWPIEVRLRQLQTGSSSKLVLLHSMEGDYEHEFHERFEHLWLHGEWFKSSPALLEFVARLKNSVLPKAHTMRWGKAGPPRYQNHKGWYWQPKVSGTATQTAK